MLRPSKFLEQLKKEAKEYNKNLFNLFYRKHACHEKSLYGTKISKFGEYLIYCSLTQHKNIKPFCIISNKKYKSLDDKIIYGILLYYYKNRNATKKQCKYCGCKTADVTNGMCERCKQSPLIFKCDNCGTFDIIDRRKYAFKSNKQYEVCLECYKNKKYCTRCKKGIYTFNIGKEFIINNEHIFLCESCGSNVSKDICSFCNKETLITLKRHKKICFQCETIFNNFIDDYQYYPKTIHYNKYKNEQTNQNTLFVGFEIEFYHKNRYNRDLVIPKLFKIFSPSEIFILYDGSVKNGIEVVTFPMTILYYKHVFIPKLKILFAITKRYKYKAQHKWAGLHISLSKDAFTVTQLYKLFKFCYDIHNKKFLIIIAGRKENYFTRFNTIYQEEKNYISIAKEKRLKHNNYCVNGHDQHYTAINIDHKNRIEFRIFRGTHSSNLFYKNVEFVLALYEFTKNYPLSFMYYEYFINFLKKKENYYKFKNLITYLERKKIWRHMK